MVNSLQQDLSQMPERKREKMKEYIRIVSGEISRLAATVGKQSALDQMRQISDD